MNITRNAVYSYVHDAVKDVHSDTYIAGIYEPVPSSLPAIYLREISDLRNKPNMTFTGMQGVRTSTFEAQVVCGKRNGSLSQAYSLLDTVRQAFFRLQYNETNVIPIEEGENGNYRLRASYRRIIGDADEMPTT